MMKKVKLNGAIEANETHIIKAILKFNLPLLDCKSLLIPVF